MGCRTSEQSGLMQTDWFETHAAPILFPQPVFLKSGFYRLSDLQPEFRKLFNNKNKIGGHFVLVGGATSIGVQSNR